MAGMSAFYLWMLVFYTLSFPLLLVLAGIALFRLRRERRVLLKRLRGVTDAETEAARIHGEATVDLNRVGSEMLSIRNRTAEKQAEYNVLLAQIESVSDRLDVAALGIYEPHFDFGDSKAFQEALNEVHGRLLHLVKTRRAVLTSRPKSVDSSANAVMARNIGLTLRAFNGQCDAAIANVRWNNVGAMEQRIVRARELLNRLNAANGLQIAKDYAALKLKELYLTHEYRQHQKREADAVSAAVEQQREELKLQRDLDAAQDEQARLGGLLVKARLEASVIGGDSLQVFGDQIKQLEREVATAQSRLMRARAMLDETRYGYVYVVSNLGSFGEGIVKIAMTRRLDPAQHIAELGDASLPFPFDVHAVIYSEDAPALLYRLHQAFWDMRLNTSNPGKDFFRVPLLEVESAVKRLAPDADFFSIAEAQDYRESKALAEGQPATAPELV